MRILGVIPARYSSSRFEGKPLAMIEGKPMIWWVYNQVIKVKEFYKVIVATDDKRIMDACNDLGMNVVMTSKDNKTPTDRIYEVSTMEDADYYISINGDEPLINPDIIRFIIPKEVTSEDFVSNIISPMKDPVEVVDASNLKVITNERGEGIYISRSPVPYPKGEMEFNYKKHVGVYAFNKGALKFYHETKRGLIERVEDIDLLRFIENGKKVLFLEKECDTLSVDSPKDLEKIKNIIKSKEK